MDEQKRNTYNTVIVSLSIIVALIILLIVTSCNNTMMVKQPITIDSCLYNEIYTTNKDSTVYIRGRVVYDTYIKMIYEYNNTVNVQEKEKLLELIKIREENMISWQKIKLNTNNN